MTKAIASIQVDAEGQRDEPLEKIADLHAGKAHIGIDITMEPRLKSLKETRASARC